MLCSKTMDIINPQRTIVAERMTDIPRDAYRSERHAVMTMKIKATRYGGTVKKQERRSFQSIPTILLRTDIRGVVSLQNSSHPDF